MAIITLRNISNFLLLCVFLAMPLGMDLVRWAMLFWGIAVLLMYLVILTTFFIDKSKVSIWADFHFVKNSLDIRFAFIIFWILYWVSGFWAEDQALAGRSIETKLTFLIIPIFFTLSYITVKWRKAIFLAFILGNLIAMVYCLNDSWSMYQENGKVNEFIMKQFSDLLHPSYFGMYLVMCTMLCGNFILDKEITWKFAKPLLFLCIFIFMVGIFLIQSKNAILAFFFIPVMLIVWYVVKNGNWKKGLIALISILVVVGVSFYVTPNLQKRFANAYDGFTKKTVKADSKESTDARLISWSAAVELIKEKPLLGFGAGQEKTNLVRIYERNGNSAASELRLDAHSQPLQSSISIGIVGLLALLYLFILLIYTGYVRRNGMIILFAFLVFFSCLTESMFERQAGVLFFVFFALLLSGMPKIGTKEPT
ncbi:MAG: O-antigen ligase family protein [Flavobacteriales bacterium]|nr:O-antigen ligase family protein [Flavobacteriales bacterium]